MPPHLFRLEFMEANTRQSGEKTDEGGRSHGKLEAEDIQQRKAEKQKRLDGEKQSAQCRERAYVSKYLHDGMRLAGQNSSPETRSISAPRE